MTQGEATTAAFQDDAFWHRVVAAANADDDFAAKSAHLVALAIRFEMGTYRWVLELHRGRAHFLGSAIGRGTAFAVSGPSEEWERLIGGAIGYAQATNVVHGRLRSDGDALAATWATRPLWRFWQLAAEQGGGGRRHA